jgi:hypothetical protein
MNAHIGLAFCVDKIYYAGFIPLDQSLALDRLGAISYPFRYDEPSLFHEDSLAPLSNLIKNKLLTDNNQEINLSVSIESNLAALKRISLPDSISKSEEKEHIHWDLSQSLIDPIDDYIYYKTDNVFETFSRKDFLTIAIKKNIISFFKKLSVELSLTLVDVSINQLVAEIALQNFLQEQATGLVLLFKIAPNKMESTYLWNGNFFSSDYERLIGYDQNEEFSEVLINNMRSKIKQMETLFEQYRQEEIKVDRIFIYGEDVTDDLLSLIKQSINVSPAKLNPLQNINKSERLNSALPSLEEATKYVESIGVVLDQ